MSELPKVTALELDLSDGWLTVWFNQPESRNALTTELVGDLINTLESIRDDREIRGITLRGKGGVFCSGGDLKSFNRNQSANRCKEEIVEESKRGAYLFDLINTMPQVTIVIIEGAAMAGGFGMACCADVVICLHDARFAMTETSLGITPAQISPFVIQKLGYATARRLMLTAARFDGREAKSFGFVDFLSERADDLEKIEAQIKKQVLRTAPGAVADIKSLIISIPYLNREEIVQTAAENFAGRILSDEGREGVASFVEKRKPYWVK